MKKQFAMVLVWVSTVVSAMLPSVAADIPAVLPKPDQMPAETDKPVKVYILAGQSNMVGMGDISGAQPPYPSVFLSADPAIIPGRMPVGTSRTRSACQWIWKGTPALGAHGAYQSDDPNAAKGGVVALHQGNYDPNVDYSQRTPNQTATVPLGTVDASLPALNGPCTPVVTAWIDVPVNGSYVVHVGFRESTHAMAVVDGKEVYRKEPGTKPILTKVALTAGTRHPIQITYFKGGSAAFWLEQVDLVGKGDLVTLTTKDKKFSYLIDDAGTWIARPDVSYIDPRLFPERPASPLSAKSNNGKSIGPELGFGWVMGTFHDEPVLVIKTAQGNRSLIHDFRPPSSGKVSDSEYEGFEYRAMVTGVQDTLANIDKVVPGYAGQGYEIVGFGWFQGHKDSGSTKKDYEKCLVDLINDLRKDLETPTMKAVVATVGFHGYRLQTLPWWGVWQAQMAVGDPEQHPEFDGTVASVDTRDFWREVEESPRGQDYHYNRNPETYLLVGEAMGRAMVRMLGGKAEGIPKSDRESHVVAAMAAEASKPVPTEEQLTASRTATKPMIIDGLLERFIADSRNQPVLQSLASRPQPKPAQTPASMDDTLDDAVAYLQAAGISEYDWKPFGPDIKSATWDYVGFDRAKPAPWREIPLPSGLENWLATDIDPKRAGWKSGVAPFGMAMEEAVPENIAWIAKYPPYPLKRPMPKTVCESDVVLLRKTFDLPQLKEGHRYRIRVAGSIHDNSGEGFAVFINGKQLAEVDTGVTAWRVQGLRGSHVWKEFLDEFKGGTVTIAVANFPVSNRKSESFIPAIGPLSVWMEEQKIPPLGVAKE